MQEKRIGRHMLIRIGICLLNSMICHTMVNPFCMYPCICIPSYVTSCTTVASHITSVFLLLSVVHHGLHELVIVYGCVLALLGANPTQAGRVPPCLFTGIWVGGSTN